MTKVTFWNAQMLGLTSKRSLDAVADNLSQFPADVYLFAELTTNADTVLNGITRGLGQKLNETFTYSSVGSGDGRERYGMIAATTAGATRLAYFDVITPRLWGLRRLGVTQVQGSTVYVYHAPPREKFGQLNLQYILRNFVADGTWLSKRVVIAGDFNAQYAPSKLFGFAHITAHHYVTTQFSVGLPIDYFVCSYLVNIVDTRSTRMTRKFSALSDHLPITMEYQ